ncbi:MAG: sugar ABC transporter ATP-binding protein [Anaerolineae bacterium]|nr:sugar ABC transporter ATP-binding protein [Anaerolineae bacterium]
MFMSPLIELKNISKHFPGVQALDDISLEIASGEIHGLLGENGAGKSTLIKILAGAHRPDGGTIELDGQPVHIENPHKAQELGIVTIYQEFNLVPQLTIAENVFIGREPRRGIFMSWGQMAAQTRALTDRLGIPLDPMTLVRDLSVAEQQMVEIARALSMKSRLIIMDEPTSALSEKEVVQLFKIMRDLREQGLSMIFITHRLEEVMETCDRITVLRDGQNAGKANVSDVTVQDIIRMMVGRPVDDLYRGEHSRPTGGETVLEVRNLRRKINRYDPHAIVLHDVSLKVRRGEILGIAGLVGAGRTEIARVIFGADPIESGEIVIEGQEAQIRSPQDAIRYGIGLVPEDRKQQALFLALAVRENMSIAALPDLLMPGGFIRAREESQLIDEYQRMLNIRMASPEQHVSNLSGGNQQKVVIARWMALQPKLLIVDEPTRGIDVGAKAEVHALLHDMAAKGIAIIMISSELPEILGMSDRIVTVREGRVTGVVNREDADEETLMKLMTLGAIAEPVE